MSQLADYSTDDIVYEGATSLVYRGRRLTDDLPVIIKLLKQHDPLLSERARYRQEFEILKHLAGVGAVRAYGLHEVDSRPALILEDVGGRSLRDMQQELVSLSLVEYLQLAVTLAEAVSSIHAAHIIHKDLHPGNVVVNLRRARLEDGDEHTKLEIVSLKLIDFGLATRLSRETPAPRPLQSLEGHLAYISPEQTGRMNRALDDRSDLYSLGVTLYELLTGRLPFPVEDAVELVHSHLARQPVPPHELLADRLVDKGPNARALSAAQRIVSAIIMKLLAKNAEDRYQSASGLAYDLRRVLDLWIKQQSVGDVGTISDAFELGQHDVVARLQIPQRLYGREPDVVRLLAAFEEMAQTGKSSLLLIAGEAGVGKSSLVHELYKPLSGRGGYFVAGKFDQLQRTIPYSALTQAFNAFCRQLLSEPTAVLGGWQQRIMASIGQNGRVITEVVPELRLIIGDQPVLPKAGPHEAQNRFVLTFQRFMTAICRPDQPLVLFLDDMQWADAASLTLLKTILLNPENRHLLVIGAYRNNEVEPSHPLMLAVEEIERQAVSTSTISLGNLRHEDVSSLVHDSLRYAPPAAADLALLVYQKTLGNAFFVHQFLHTLVDELLLRFELDRQQWAWDVTQIQARNITDNVVELLARKLRELPQDSAYALQLAACIGDQFDLTTLSLVSEQEQDAIARSLWLAQLEGFILALDVPLQNQAALRPVEQMSGRFRFVHDRVQQAAYLLMDEQRRQATHLMIGRLLLSRTESDRFGAWLFEIVDHLNGGRALLNDVVERQHLAELNLMAGRRARASAAYGPAMSYFRIGLALLPSQAWDEAYALALALHTEAASASYLAGDPATTFELAATAQAKAQDVLDQVPVYEVLIQAINAQRQPARAVETALEVLRLLGISFPAKPAPADIGREFAQTAELLSHHPLDKILDLPPTELREIRAIMRIIAGVTDAAYHVAPDLMPLLVCTQVQLSVKHGLTPETAVAFGLYGLMLCGAVGDIETGAQFGQLALRVLERFKADEHRALTLVAVYNNIMPWKIHPRLCLPHLLDAYHSGLESGDLTFASVGAHAYCYHAYFVGTPLGELAGEMAKYEQAIAKLGQQSFLNYHRMYYQAVLNLVEPTAAPIWLQGPIYDHVAMHALNVDQHDITALFVVHFNHCVLAYLLGDYQQAADQAAQAEQYLGGAVALIHVAILNFYDSLARLALVTDASEPQRVELLGKVAANQVRLRAWAKHAPDNHQHKVDLIAAEQARIAGDPWQAARLYEQACAGAKRHQYLQEEAIAYEVAARFYEAAGMERAARMYLVEAYSRYRAWGATAKLQQLAGRYPQIPELAIHDQRPGLRISSLSVWTTTRFGPSLDLAAVMKSLQVIARPLELEQLLSRVMNVILENVGAEQGVLLLPSSHFQHNPLMSGPAAQRIHGPMVDEHGNTWLIQAAATINRDDTQVLQAITVQDDGRLPLAILHYVVHTQSPLILDDATTAGDYLRDPYVRTQQPKSVACVPLLNQGRLIGIIYLENNLTTGAFNQGQMEVLQLLSAQLAISLDNALLYRAVQRHRDHLETLVAERTHRLEAALKESDRLFAEAERAKATAESASRAKSDFLATMSHELRTPLNAVLGFSQLLQRDTDLSATQAEHVRVINRSGEHLLKLINDVLDLSKIEAGQMTVHNDDVDLRRLLDDLRQMFRLRAEEKGIRFNVECWDNVPQFIHTDESKLRQVLINLLGNAVKFTSAGSVTLRIIHRETFVIDHSHTQHGEQQANVPLRFEVSDTGPGVTPDELAYLFAPFVQADAGRRAYEGTGLGLSLSRRFAALLGGDLTVNSQVGHGSTFVLDIVVRPSAIQLDLPAQPVEPTGLAEGQPVYRLLIVDDMPHDRLLLRRLLEPLGFVIAEAENGEAALEAWRAWRPHLVWMDGRMPVMDGATATRHIRALETDNTTVVIAIIAGSLGEERARMLAAGCDDVLFKPFRAETIFAALEQHLNVRFVDNEAVVDSSQSRIMLSRLTPEQLQLRIASLPAAWVSALRGATIGCDLNRIYELIGEMQSADPVVTESLTAWADDFDYDQILAALEGA